MPSEMINSYVYKCIQNLKELDPVYFKKCLEQRLVNGLGSTTEANTVEEMEGDLMDANWEPWEDKLSVLTPGCKAFITYDIPGHYGMINLEDRDPNEICFFADPKNTGMLSLCIATDDRTDVDYTVLIIGPEGNKDVMFTFHPGEPIPASTFKSGDSESGGSGYEPGDKITVADAMKLGFKRAKAE